MNQQQPWNGPQQGMGNGQQFGGPQGQGFSPQQGMPPQGGQQFGGPQGGPPQGGPGGPQYFGGPATQTKPKSKAPLIVGGVLGAGLLVGGGVLAYNWWGGSDSSAATEGIPSDAIAVFELALNPPKDDQLALSNIIQKFPAAEAPDTTDYKEALWHALTKDANDAPDYETEIKPWLGDSLSIGVIPGGEKAVEIVAAIQVTDEDEAKAFAEREFADDAQFFFHDGLMVVHEGSVDEASLAEGSLADHEEYKEDLGELDGSRLATAWFGTGAGELLLEELDAPELSGTDLQQIEALQSAHGAAALKVDDDLLSIDYSVFSDQPSGADEEVNDAVAALPDDAAIAVSAAFNAEMIDYMWRQLESDPQMTSQLGQFGIGSSSDLHAVLGKQLTFALAAVDQQEPKFGLQIVSDDIAKHESTVQQLVGGDLSQAGVDSKVDGDTATYAYGYGIDDLSSGNLGDNEAYQSVITEDASAIMFLNVAQLVDAFGADMRPEEAENLKPLHALGMTANANGQRSEGELKLSFR